MYYLHWFCFFLFCIFWALNDIFSIFFPLLSPFKISFTRWTIFSRFHFWVGDLNLNFVEKQCFNFLPVTLFLHNLNEENFRLDLMSRITSFSFRPNLNWIASKGFLSSQAISLNRSVSVKFKCLIWFFNQLLNTLLEISNWLCTYILSFPFVFKIVLGYQYVLDGLNDSF